MLIAVFADSHGELDGMCAAIDGHRPDMVLHLGDYARDAESLEKYYPGLDIRYVRGNCDGWYSDAARSTKRWGMSRCSTPAARAGAGAAGDSSP